MKESSRLDSGAVPNPSNLIGRVLMLTQDSVPRSLGHSQRIGVYDSNRLFQLSSLEWWVELL